MGLLPANPKESLLPLELEEALDHKKPVIMEYLDAGDQRTERRIVPVRLRKANQELLLVAHCELRQAQRTFKVERIVQMKPKPSTTRVISSKVPLPAMLPAMLPTPSAVRPIRIMRRGGRREKVRPAGTPTTAPSAPSAPTILAAMTRLRS